MKLNNKKKRTKTILIVLAVVAIIAVLGAVFLLINKSNQGDEKEPGDITDIQFSAYPNKSTYYVGEEFDPTGVRVQVLTYDYDLSYFVDHTKLTFSGFDSSEVNDALPITVSYKGFTTSFNVKIVPEPDPTPHITDIEVVGLKTEYTLEEWLSGVRVLGSKLRLIYSDESVVEKNVQYSMIYGYTQEVSAPCSVEITIKYNDNGDLHEIPVTITITE